LNLDDCWAKKDRNEQGELEADPEKFPNGMPYLVKHVQASYFKFGIYSCAGT
jgi:alpha-galactosidase